MSDTRTPTWLDRLSDMVDDTRRPVWNSSPKRHRATWTATPADTRRVSTHRGWPYN